MKQLEGQCHYVPKGNIVYGGKDDPRVVVVEVSSTKIISNHLYTKG